MIHDGPPMDDAPATGRALALHRPAPTAIDKQQMKQYLQAIRDPEALKLQQELAAAYDAAVGALIGPNDVQVEGSGKNARSFKKKSAWRKIGRYFGISTEVVKIDREFLDGTFLATVTVRATAPWGQSLESVGACSQDEATGRRTITIADAIATASTRATNRAVSDLVAMGEVSAEEIRKGEGGDVANAPDMTLEEALAQPWPWKGRPASLDGKTLGETPTKMLLVASDWAEKKISAGTAGRAVHMLAEAAVLILEQRDDLEAASAELAAERPKKAQQGSGAEPSEAPATTPAATSRDPADAPPPEASEEPDPSTPGGAASGSSSSGTATGGSTPSDERTAPGAPTDDEGEVRPNSQGAPIEALFQELREIVQGASGPAKEIVKFEKLLLRRDLTEQEVRRAIGEARMLLDD